MTAFQTNADYNNPQCKPAGVPEKELLFVFDQQFVPVQCNQISVPELSDDEIDSLCEEVKLNLRTNCPEVYAPC